MNTPKRDRSSRRRTAVAASLALAGTLLAVPYIAQAATADEPVTEPVQATPAELLREQISRAANDLYDTAHKDASTGYSNLVVSTKDSGYTLYWKGEIPAAVTKLIDAQRTQGLRISIQDAAYTRQELDAKAQVIARPDATVGGDTITSVGPSNDGNGLDVTVEPASFVIPGSQQELDALENDRSALASLTGGIPVNLTKMAAGTPTIMVPKAPDMTRFQASGYLPGGAGIGSPNYCTTGFTVVDPLTQVKYMTTAAHCVNKIGETVKNGNKDKVLGKVIDIQEYNDSALIAIDPGVKTSPTVYSEHGLGIPGGTTRRVAYSSRTFVGELLCADGALLGEQCGGKVVALGRQVWDRKNKHYRLLDKVEQVAGRYMAGAGDSGGPVYAGRTGTGNALYAAYPRGVISMTVDGQSCINPIPGVGKYRPNCSPNIWITNLENSLQLHAQALRLSSLRVDTFR
ncbi:hypothetical protein ABZ766_32120 [Streptomyces sp. NPDC006670]|uniref:hypothetical protein n=1 Tax=Streptomyces sp. NPDC006670 TaxID=3154476 RepID=UPI003405AE04